MGIFIKTGNGDSTWEPVTNLFAKTGETQSNWSDAKFIFAKTGIGTNQWSPIFGTVIPTITPSPQTINGTLTLNRGLDISGSYDYVLKRADNITMTTNVTTVKSGTLTGSTTTTTYATSSPNDTNKYFQLEVTYAGKIYYSNIVRVVRYSPVFTVSPYFYNPSTGLTMTEVPKSTGFVVKWEWNNTDAYDVGSYTVDVSTNTDGSIYYDSGTISGGGSSLTRPTSGSISILYTSSATTITVTVELTNTGGTTTSHTTLNVTSGPPVNTALPSITPTSGYAGITEFTVSNGSWSGSPSTYQYQWQSTYPLGGGQFSDVGSATSNKWTPPLAHAGYIIKCNVRASNGIWSDWASSSNTITLQSPPAPTISTNPLATAAAYPNNLAGSTGTYTNVSGTVTSTLIYGSTEASVGGSYANQLNTVSRDTGTSISSLSTNNVAYAGYYFAVKDTFTGVNGTSYYVYSSPVLYDYGTQSSLVLSSSYSSVIGGFTTSLTSGTDASASYYGIVSDHNSSTIPSISINTSTWLVTVSNMSSGSYATIYVTKTKTGYYAKNSNSITGYATTIIYPGAPTNASVSNTTATPTTRTASLTNSGNTLNLEFGNTNDSNTTYYRTSWSTYASGAITPTGDANPSINTGGYEESRTLTATGGVSVNVYAYNTSLKGRISWTAGTNTNSYSVTYHITTAGGSTTYSTTVTGITNTYLDVTSNLIDGGYLYVDNITAYNTTYSTSTSANFSANATINSVIAGPWSASGYFTLTVTQYTVTWVSSDGSVSPSSSLVNAGSSVTTPSSTSTGAVVTGWYTSGNSRVASGGASYTPSSSITLYAQTVRSFTPAAYVTSGTEYTSASANFTGSTDDGYWTFTLPYTIKFNGSSYDTLYVGTNSYITFGSGSTAYSGLSASNPPYNKIMVYAADRSSNSCWFYNGGNTFIIELRCGLTAGTPGSDIVWKLYSNNSTYPNGLEARIYYGSGGTTMAATTNTSFSSLGGNNTGWRITSQF